MRMSLVFVFVLVLGASADQFVYVRDGKVASAPRDLPSCGVDSRTGEVVLGLHGASAATQAACGWYRVVPSATAPLSNEVVVGRSYSVNKSTVREVLVLKERKQRTVRERMSAVFASPDLADMSEEDRCAAVIAAVAQVVTQRLDRTVTVSIPARKTEKEPRK